MLVPHPILKCQTNIKPKIYTHILYSHSENTCTKSSAEAYWRIPNLTAPVFLILQWNWHYKKLWKLPPDGEGNKITIYEVIFLMLCTFNAIISS